MSLAAVLLLVLLVPLTSFAPGFFLVRRIRRWGPLEKLAASLGASIVLIYLVAFAIYVTGLPWSTAWGFTGLAALALVAARHDARRLFAAPQVGRVARLFGGLFLWNVLMLAIVRHYGGGFWGPDWYEHYERAMFFLDRGPVDYEFLGLYLLPARPPLLNLFSTFFLAQAGTQFSNFQLTFVFANLLPFVALVLLSSVLVKGGSRRAGLLAIVLACNPMFLHNVQFTWTKSATAFFIVLALWFYVVGWRRHDSVRMSLAFLSLSAGALVHYSAVPYALLVGLHYVVWILRRRHHPWKELIGIAVPSAVLLTTWLAYSLGIYGLRLTLATNTAVTDAESMTAGENLLKMAANVYDTVVPHLARGIWIERDGVMFRQVVDNAFVFYQVNLPFAFGAGGIVLLLFLIARSVLGRGGGAPGAERGFWLLFTTLGVLFSIAVHGGRDIYGLAHIGLQPLVQIGLAWLAASLPTIPRTLRIVLLAGMAADAVMGVAILVRLESLLAGWAVDYNLEVKDKAAVIFLGDGMAAWTTALQVVLWVAFAALLARAGQVLLRLPEADWRGGRRRAGPSGGSTV